MEHKDHDAGHHGSEKPKHEDHDADDKAPHIPSPAPFSPPVSGPPISGAPGLDTSPAAVQAYSSELEAILALPEAQLRAALKTALGPYNAHSKNVVEWITAEAAKL